MQTIHEIFPMFEPELLDEIREKGIFKTYKKGETLITQENYIRSIPLILDGFIKISRHDDFGNEIVLYYIKQGETCANTIQCCENQKKSNIVATAEADVELIFIPIELLETWTIEYRSWKDFLLMSYKKRFDDIIQTIDKIAFTNLHQRLEEYLYDKKSTIDSNIITITHQQIAYDLNSTREVISKYLKEMEMNGLLILHRGRIELLKS